MIKFLCMILYILYRYECMYVHVFIYKYKILLRTTDDLSSRLFILNPHIFCVLLTFFNVLSTCGQLTLVTAAFLFFSFSFNLVIAILLNACRSHFCLFFNVVVHTRVYSSGLYMCHRH